jgi:hypothetical protein
MLPQWSVHEAIAYLNNNGWKVEPLVGHSLVWSYHQVGSFLVLSCSHEDALCTPTESGIPLEEAKKTLLSRFPIPLNGGFPLLWRELNLFYGREMPTTEYEAVALLENGRLSPALEALCQAHLPKHLPEPLNRVYRDWEVRYAARIQRNKELVGQN